MVRGLASAIEQARAYKNQGMRGIIANSSGTWAALLGHGVKRGGVNQAPSGVCAIRHGIVGATP